MRHIGGIAFLNTKHVSNAWDQVASNSTPSWYLDPLVAKQKREVHQMLVRKWVGSAAVPQTILKTDLFEEAFGADRLLADLMPGAPRVVGIDVAQRTVAEAKRNTVSAGLAFVAGDARLLPFKAASFDLVFSNSTLDHFDDPADLQTSLRELVRVVRPGGLLLITLDNPWNPLYHVLRIVTRRGWAPFELGATLSKGALNASLRKCGMEVLGNEWLIHNPRLVSTAVFMVLRRMFGKRADLSIAALLRLFATLEQLPTHQLTACFVAACARKEP